MSIRLAFAVAAAGLLTACTTSNTTSSATPNTQPAPIASSPTSSALDSIDWVVEGSAMSRGVNGETYSLICVARAELGWDQTRQTHFRQVQTSKDVATNTPDGSICPQGRPILAEW